MALYYIVTFKGEHFFNEFGSLHYMCVKESLHEILEAGIVHVAVQSVKCFCFFFIDLLPPKYFHNNIIQCSFLHMYLETG